MVKTRKPAKSAKDVYQKVDDLPEVKKKAYNSILEDFDRQGIYYSKQNHSNDIHIKSVIFENYSGLEN